MIDLFDAAARRYPDRIAVVCNGRRESFAALQTLTVRHARQLRSAGYGPGSRIAVLAHNDLRVVATLLAILRADAAWVAVNPTDPIDAVVAALQRAGTSCVVCGPEWIGRASELRARVTSITAAMSFDELSADSLSDEAPASPDGRSERLAAVLWTGGTSGVPRAVECDLSRWRRITDEFCGRLPNAERPVWMGLMPLVYRGWPLAFALLARGSALVLPCQVTPPDIFMALNAERVSHLSLSPAALYALLAHPEVREHDYSALHVLLLAGAPVSAAKLAEAVDVFGDCVWQLYGQIETGPLAWLDAATLSAALRGDHAERLWSCGQPAGSVGLAVHDADGRPCAAGAEGEIVAHVDGNWHRTGDIGVIDVHGFVYIRDRQRDLIVTGGHNVASAEVESVILEEPGVSSCAVIGVPDPLLGERVAAIVVASSEGSVDERSILSRCRRRLGRRRTPLSVEFVDALPQTAAGKVDKNRLREAYWHGHSRAVH